MKELKRIVGSLYRMIFVGEKVGYISVFMMVFTIICGSTESVLASVVLKRSSIGYNKANEKVHTTNKVKYKPNNSAFRLKCAFSHMAYDDPILYPGQPGRPGDGSHLHTFFGNTAANAFVKDAHPDPDHNDLRGLKGNSTCTSGISNSSAYWIPTLINVEDGNTPLVPIQMNVYYKSSIYGVEAKYIEMLPPGDLRMIAGKTDVNDVDSAKSNGNGQWQCRGSTNNTKPANTDLQWGIPDCSEYKKLRLELHFPQCWNGKLHSSDQSHMKYARKGGRRNVSTSYGQLIKN